MSSWNNARVWTLAVVLTMTGTALLAAGAPATSATSRTPATSAASGALQWGLASYYGPGFHGEATASGEIFNMYEMVAAHRSLPLGSVVRVTNLKNSRRVTLRVIDRGPYGRNYRKGTIIDVSKGAAHRLGFIRDGLVPVRVEVLKLPRADRGRP